MTDPMAVPTLADLRALVSRPAVAFLQGRASVGDFGGGIFNWIAGDTSSGDDGMVVSLGDGAYRRQVPEDVIAVEFYGAGLGGDDTDAIQKAFDASVRSSGRCARVQFSTKLYRISGKIVLPANFRMCGVGPERTRIYCRTDFGDIFVCGDDSNPAGGPEIDGIWFLYGSVGYRPGDTSLADRATSGAWFRLYGSQQAWFTNCYFYRKPYAVYFHGGTLMRFDNCSFVGVWDHTLEAVQEGISYLVFDVHPTHGNPKDLFLTRSNFFGAKSAERNVTINGRTVSMIENIGSKHSLLIFGLETATCIGNYFQCANESAVALRNKPAGAIANIRIVANFLDSSRIAEISACTLDASMSTLSLLVALNQCNGEMNGKSIVVIDVLEGSHPSVFNFQFIGNSGQAYFGSPLCISGAIGGRISENTLFNWNCQRFFDAGENYEYTSAGLFNGVSAKLRIRGNAIGGGGNQLSDSGAADNFCFDGFAIDPANVALGVTQKDTDNNGVANISFMTQPAVPAAAELYVSRFSEDADVYIYGGTISALKLNGQTIASGPNRTVRVRPNDSLAWFGTVAPTWAWLSTIAPPPAG